MTKRLTILITAPLPIIGKEKNVNLPKLQALIAPLSAPIPSALGVALGAYLYFLPQSAILGWLAAVGAFAGIETLGGASCYALVKLHRQRDYSIEFWIAFCGIVAYIGSGVYTLAGSPLIIFFFLAPFSYFAYSILKSMEIEITDRTAETEAQIALINAETRRTNAETRKTKAGITGRQRAVQNVQSVGALNDVNARRQAEKQAGLDKVLDYLSGHPDASLSAIGEHVGKGKATAKNYTDELAAAGKLHRNGDGWKVNGEARRDPAGGAG
jgi:hypothetical protein